MSSHANFKNLSFITVKFKCTYQCTAFKLQVKHKRGHPPCAARCAWHGCDPCFFCVCTVNRPEAFSATLLVGWITALMTAYNRCEHFKDIRTYTLIFPCTRRCRNKGLRVYTSTRLTQRPPERCLNDRGCTPKHKCTVINWLLSDTPPSGGIRLYSFSSHSLLVMEKKEVQCSGV